MDSNYVAAEIKRHLSFLHQKSQTRHGKSGGGSG